MLLLPYLAGLRFGVDWLHIPLLLGWLTGWLASYHLLLWVKTGRFLRVRAQVLAFGAACAATLLPVVALRPGLAWFAPAFAVLLAVNVVLTRAGQERSSVNGIASVTMASLMAMIVPATAGLDWRLGVPVALVAWAYLAGSVLYVKTMIREHGSLIHRVVSALFHAAALVATTAYWPWLAATFGLLLARAVILPARARLRVAIIGASEVGVSLVVLASLLLMPV